MLQAGEFHMPESIVAPKHISCFYYSEGVRFPDFRIGSMLINCRAKKPSMIGATILVLLLISLGTKFCATNQIPLIPATKIRQIGRGAWRQAAFLIVPLASKKSMKANMQPTAAIAQIKIHPLLLSPLLKEIMAGASITPMEV